MFKISSKPFSQQRATLKPIKNSAIYEETEEEEEDDDAINEEDDVFLEDGSSSCYSSGIAGTAGYHDTRNETMMLAQFLASTGPEEYASQIVKNGGGDSKAQQQFKRASRLLSRLRKRPTMPVLRAGQAAPIAENGPPSAIKKNYIPLPVYEAPEMHATNTTTSHGNTNTTTTNTNTNTTKSSSPQLPKISTSPTHLNVTPHHHNKSNNRKSFNQSTTLSPMQLRDSGIYSETASERDSSVVSSTTYNSSAIPTIPPLPHFLTDLQQFPTPPYVMGTKNSSGSNSPRRPAPMPPAMASAAIAACSPSSVVSTSTVRSVPEAALKRRSVRLRHVQVQTETGTSTDDLFIAASNAKSQIEDKQACPHCRQVVTVTAASHQRMRRPSCPPALSSGATLSTQIFDMDMDDGKETDAKKLLAMIMNLKSQLAEEKQCRLKLEKAMYQRQSEDRREMLAKEKDRWAGDCLWLNDRIALLPE